MRALITGGAGFIGSHLSEALLAAGHHVTIIDDFSTGSIENIQPLMSHPRFSNIVGSVLNEALVADAIGGVDVVFHLAAAVGVRLVVDAPIHTIQSNVNGTEIVLRHASRMRTPVLVASTSEVYGKGLELPFRETADIVLGPPNKPRWGYAASKLIDEFLAIAYWKEHCVPTVVVRLFNTVGPRQSSRYGMVLPNFVRRAIAGRALTIHGDGSQTRSFTWVGDVVSAMTRLVTETRAYGEVFNVGHGGEISIRDLALRVRAIAGSNSPLEFVPYAQVFDADFEDMPRRVPDVSKLKQLIGFTPSVDLDSIIERTVAYWAERRPKAEPVTRVVEMARPSVAVAV